ncbi:hypothetical protein RUM44_000591 [Polyplax serrata]|uniref:Uncharacterized protein n=1 Tax=Polyplax serrata TaxID=468196 RepID=A0ABR1B8S3_POLSC
MTDVLDEILDHLSPSTLEIVQNYGDNSIQDSKNLDQLLAEFQEIRLGQMTKELQRRCLNIKYKSAENSQILTKLLKDLKLQESLNTSCDYNQRIEALMKQLNAYNEKIKEQSKNEGSINSAQLFMETENLFEEIEKMRLDVTEAKNKYKCFDGIPPTIEGAKKAVEEIKQQIILQEKQIDNMFLNPAT